MRERSFDEMIAYFNRKVSEMDIAQDYKVELFGMVAALGYKHEKTARQWIPCSERLPEIGEMVLATTKWNTVTIVRNMELYWEMCGQGFGGHYGDIIAWMPLPEPWRGEEK